jgi:hypothetical protein
MSLAYTSIVAVMCLVLAAVLAESYSADVRC